MMMTDWCFLGCVVTVMIWTNFSVGSTTTTEPSNTCASQPCLNGGTCVRLSEAYVCQCRDGFIGLRCETPESTQEQSACASQPCVHGLCHSTNPSQYTCMCYAGWKGSNCNIDDNECLSVYRCTTQQTCVNLIGSYECRCPPGFTGVDCDEDICTTAPCENNGMCERAADTEQGYVCQCEDGFGGHDCQATKCSDADNFCRNGGSCYQADDSRFCQCMPGYSGNFCEVREYAISPCDSQPCGNNSMCVEDDTEDDGYVCMPACNSKPCQNGGSCVTSPNDPNSYTCECSIGYTGRLCNQKLEAVCYYNGEIYLHGEVRIAECNKCHCKYGSWLCTTKFCGTISVMFDFQEDYSLITGRTSRFQNAFQLHLAESVNIQKSVIQDLQVTAGSIHIEFILVATSDVELNIEETAKDVLSLLDSGSYIFPFEGYAFHVDVTSVKLEKHDVQANTEGGSRPVVTHTLLVVVCVVVVSLVVLATIAGLIMIFVKRNKSEKTAVGQFATSTDISMNNTRHHNNLENSVYNSVRRHSNDDHAAESDNESSEAPSSVKDVNIYKTTDFCY